MSGESEPDLTHGDIIAAKLLNDIDVIIDENSDEIEIGEEILADFMDTILDE